MTVFDVVKEVQPGTLSSYPAGRWFVTHYNVRSAAEMYAEMCNACVYIPGIRYRVEQHAELCPGRAKREHETHAVGECGCRSPGDST